MRFPDCRCLLTALVGALLLAGTAHAEPTLTRVFPNGAQRGATVELSFGGKEIPDSARLVVDGTGIEAVGPFVKGVGKVHIAPDAAPGPRMVRLVGPKSATPPRPFAVGTLPEVNEKEPNNDAAQAQRIDQLPVVINGTLPTRPDLDVFRVSLKKGECLVAAGESRALGAPTNLITRIRDMSGHELAIQMDARTRDTLLGFVAPADGDYLVEIQDVLNNYSTVDDTYVYRLTLTKGAWIDTVFPNSAQRGTTAHLTFNGWNLGGHPGPGSVTADLPIPAEAPQRYPVTAGDAANQATLITDSLPETIAPRTGGVTNAGAAAPGLTLPTVINGILSARGEVDRYRFTARSGQKLDLRTHARDLGSAADLFLSVHDADGKSLTSQDDTEGSRDPHFLWTAPRDGEFTVAVRDIASRGGEDYFYRLVVAPPVPALTLKTPAPNLTLKTGAKLEVPVTAAAWFLPTEATVTVEGLPPGVTAAPLRIGASPDRLGSTELKVVLTAAADAKPFAGLIRIRATAAGAPPAAATAKWVLSTDRSGTLAEGTTDGLLLQIPEP